jgi:aspartate/methionine/tyrosine aminotransferase
LNSPNNPTGWTATNAEVETILGLCRRHGVWLIADEVYSRLVYDESAAAPSLLDIADPNDRVIVCNSFSKTYAMTGWRLGWLVVPEGARDTIAEIVEVTHSGVAPFAQAGGLAALADDDFVAAFRAYCATGRRLAVDALAGLNGVRLRAPDGAFYAFVRIEGFDDSVGLARRLVVDHGVAVAPGAAFGSGGEGHLRICFARAPETISRAMARLRAGLAQA